MQFCDLPQLPGRKPFGGQILSHDFVEAALLLEENWQVWFAYDLEGSYEEAPQTMIENASATAAGARAICSTASCSSPAACAASAGCI